MRCSVFLAFALGTVGIAGTATAFQAPSLSAKVDMCARSALTLKASDSAPDGCPDSKRRRFVMASAAAILSLFSQPAHSAMDFPTNLFKMGGDIKESELPLKGDESIMRKKAHGTSDKAVMKNLRFSCDPKLADNICNFNRQYAEYAGYFATTTWLDQVDKTKETTYYDSVTGKALFIAPRGRTFDEFLKESKVHGWPSFRDQEVVWENVRCIGDGETVSLSGTHLGHNLPDRAGNRYCINLVSIAGRPEGSSA